MKLQYLPKTTDKKKKRKGRGFGSGVGGHTSTRGQKGQKARSSVAIWFEGGQLPLAKRVPFLRGKDRFKTVTQQVSIINVGRLNHLPDNTQVTKELLVKEGLLNLKEAGNNTIKILATGSLDKKLSFTDMIVSKAAQAKIKKAGGEITVQ